MGGDGCGVGGVGGGVAGANWVVALLLGWVDGVVGEGLICSMAGWVDIRHLQTGSLAPKVGSSLSVKH